MKHPLPFSITIHGIGYDVGGVSLFTNRKELEADLLRTLNSHVTEGVEVDFEIKSHAYKYRKGTR